MGSLFPVSYMKKKRRQRVFKNATKSIQQENSRAKLPPTKFGFRSYTQSPHHMSLHCSSDESLNLSTFILHYLHCTLGHKPASCFPNLFPLLSGLIEDYSPALPFGYCSCMIEFQPEESEQR